MAEARLLVGALPPADDFTDKWIGAAGIDDHLITLPLDLAPIGINHILNVGDNLPQIFTLANARAAPIPLVDQFSIPPAPGGGPRGAWNNPPGNRLQRIILRRGGVDTQYNIVGGAGAGANGKVYKIRHQGNNRIYIMNFIYRENYFPRKYNSDL
jgi:hypothetical protein